jgi:outer membrane protein OmpA-like peptidoglycan-associated protein
MTSEQSNTGYVFLAVALAASLLYQPVIAADPAPEAPGGAQPGAAAAPKPLQQDFDKLISEIEARQPAQDRPAETEVAAKTGTTEDQLNAARIEIGILQQAVIAALAARAEAEAQLEALWQDSQAEISALKATQKAGAMRVSALQSELARAKGTTGRAPDEAVAAAAAGTVQATGAAAAAAPAAASARAASAGPAELMLNEIHFNPGSATLTPGAERKTLEAADKAKALGARNVRVAGYSDTQGPAAYNVHLSLQRAKSIADLLASVGVASEIIEVEGHGEEGAPEPTPDQVSEPLNRCAGIFAMVDLPADPAQQ